MYSPLLSSDRSGSREDTLILEPLITIFDGVGYHASLCSRKDSHCGFLLTIGIGVVVAKRGKSCAEGKRAW
jgi:hypothetical protein